MTGSVSSPRAERRPRVGVVIQARMGSERLPGKVLQDVAGKPMLARVLSRVLLARTVDRVILATTTKPVDDPLLPVAAGLSVPVWRGSEDDVLSRYLGAAREHALDVVVRVTADCPLIDPDVIDLCVAHFLAQSVAPDYSSDTWPRSVPTGLDVEVFSRAALEKAAAVSTAKRDREHVTLYMKEHPETFRISPVLVTTEALDARWTVDEPADLAFVRAVYEALGPGDAFSWREVLGLVRRRPDVAAINAHVRQRAP